jgi:hypothetical protein
MTGREMPLSKLPQLWTINAALTPGAWAAGKYTPFGPADRTMERGGHLAEILKDRKSTTVCGYNYVVDYPEWKRRFDAGPIFGGYRSRNLRNTNATSR